MHSVPVLRATGEYRSHEVAQVLALSGEPLAEVDQAPPLLVRRSLDEQRRAPEQSTEERLAALRTAGELFRTAELGGESPQQYTRSHALATGTPVGVAERALDRYPVLTAGLESVLAGERPAGVGAGARWVPRGSVLGVVAPSNHPGVHTSWLQALALGYRVAVRPGARDPFTPARLIRALRAAGLEPGWATLLPGSHAAADALVAAADLAMVYGGPESEARYGGSDRVKVRGPGRTKVLVLGDNPSEEDLDHLVREIAGDGGVRCTNTTAVFTDGDHGRLAQALADRLAKLPVLPVTDPGSALPARTVEEAAALYRTLDGLLAGAVEVSAAHYAGERHPLVDGYAVLRPAVLRCDRPDHPGLGVELPFPCVWVAPWTPQDGIAPMRGSLALTVLAETGHPHAEDVLRQALDEPTVRSVLDGPVVDWGADPQFPHDGQLSQFLMEARGFARAQAESRT
ncbi:acyl-CoA reductase-like NAD-dependent aldehyde dehydrogenase [Kitasatospora sp. MAA4]|uniref:aldehyde dehydrogenase family protein n=1 Tax=Kitasatospora sp. MAA4 TaxID=3035093 RepID=UPI0024743CAC|nr:aldehyde dehydrogenase family protein [Kitasatospora sp. MAA4]MDH6131742.1 acyl-CoA reductase-like NAD-dependent aldehyde dehydrogenase [Kitasatospora sp. MAA4]